MKKTVLNDDAGIYQPRKEESEKQKWKRMEKGQRVQYFFDYYLMKLVVGLVCLSVIGFLVWSFVKPKEEKVLCIAVIDEQLDEKKVAELTKELNELYQADGKKKTVLIDDTFYMQAGGLNKLEVYLYNKQADVIIAEESTYQELAGYGFFRNMDELLQDESRKKYKNKYVFASGYQETEEVSLEDSQTGKGKKLPYGISLSESDKFCQIKNHLEKPVLSAAENAPNKENIEKFLDYLMEKEERK